MPRTILPRICRACGITFAGGPRAWYCPTCRKDRRNAATSAYKDRRKRGLSRPIGSVAQCVVCGGDYSVSGSNQRYCPDCAPCAIKEVDTEQGLAYYRTHSDTINPLRRADRNSRATVQRTCVICGKVFLGWRNQVVCGDECRAIRLRQHWAKADAKRRAPKP